MDEGGEGRINSRCAFEVAMMMATLLLLLLWPSYLSPTTLPVALDLTVVFVSPRCVPFH